MTYANLKTYWTRSVALSSEIPTVFLHGFTGLASDWKPLWQNLASGQQLALDLPGHGANPQNDCCFEAMTAQIWQDLDDMQINTIHLVGYSMGGRLALYLALMFPQRIQSTVLISASAGLAEAAARKGRQKADEQLAKRLEQHGLEDFLKEWYQQDLFAGLRQWSGFEALVHDKLKHHQATRLAQSLRQGGTGVAPSMWEHLPELQMPTLFVSGQKDHKFCQLGQQMQALCPDSQFEIVAGGHAPHLEGAPALAERLKDFWQKIKVYP